MPPNLVSLKKGIKIGSLLLIASCFFYSPFVLAANLYQKAEALNLHQSRVWHQLVHYKDSIWGMESEISSPNFFNAVEGRTNPKEELKETLKAFARPVDAKSPDEHPQCRFKARYNWLKKNLNWESTTLPEVDCLKYKKWSKAGNIKSVSFIFATGYLGNPASFFGHPLVKFNQAKGANNHALLDNTLNYGALTPESEDPLTYSLKGLFGGYDAAFTHLQFYHHNHNYSENESRDMWEYSLNLKKEEVDLIVDHSWEMLGQKIPYYFTHDNCAFRMAELLNLVVKENILPKGVPYAIPHTLFDRIAHMKHNGGPLVREVRYIPSRRSRMTRKYLALSPEQKQRYKNIIQDLAYFNSNEYESLEDSEKSKLLEALLDHTLFRLSDDRENKQLITRKKVLLLERLRLPAGGTKVKESTPSPVHKGQRPVLTRISPGQWGHNNTFVDFELRPAYYDLLSTDKGRLPYSSLGIGRILARKEKNRFTVRELDFFSVSALNIAKTDLPGEGSLAWNMKLGITSQEIQCSSCQVLRVKAGMGKAFLVTEYFAFYGFGNGLAQNSVNDFGTLATEVELGAVLTISESWRALVRQLHTQYLNQDETYLNTFSLDQRFGSSRSWDVRLSYRYQNTNLLKLSYSYYW